MENIIEKLFYSYCEENGYPTHLILGHKNYIELLRTECFKLGYQTSENGIRYRGLIILQTNKEDYIAVGRLLESKDVIKCC